ncbi:hypothetical protein H0B56_06115 [Haloechinothrix sp. YIM 98757]|uniref:Uncharacterized protein n=1 Tax=Haloechinothrix aidingensis TaxID=2752311 RepID=A0A838A978_9PSEU|nr:hypothetical protein [Haloechinothrix aidingensis]MBA0125112.1 hypothetical protein [Haloechinothrix aidingensis]
MNDAIPAAHATVGRRNVLAASGIGALAALWPAGQASAQGTPPGHTVFDVACLGGTFSANFGEAIDADGGDFRGVGFFVEGLLYPEGTIPDGDGFDPASAEATGLWLCRGWFMFHPDRPLPHVVTTQEYLFGAVSGDNPSPADQLVSSGLEGGVSETVRSAIGGTGRFRHHSGEVVQQVIGTNTTVLRDIGEHAPNFRFTFRK